VQFLLEPAGVAARDARECLLLQLDAQLDIAERTRRGASDDGPLVSLPGTLRVARRLIEDHFDDLMKNRLPRIAERSGLGLDEIRAGLEALRRLSLAPARRLESARAEPIMPDVIVEYDEQGDRYVAFMNDSRTPNLRINREYALLAKDDHLQPRDKEFIKKNLSNAQWLMDAVEQRRGTLLRVVGVVLAEQRDAFDYGVESMKPLPMTQVAEQLGVHVATVSRAVSDKHLLTPRGVMPLRKFFTGGLATESGVDVSYDTVKAAVQDVVDAEDKAKPLSDEAIVGVLKGRGIEIARRTVAKYRSQLEIPSARLRKQF
jgi:RNA polymerase sigma-54 factor